MIRQILIRLGLGVLTLFVISALVFFSIEALPGDAASRALDQQVPPDQVELVRKELGLDRPVLERYGAWLAGFVRGDLGVSGIQGRPVWDSIAPLIKNTAVLAVATMIFLVPLAVLFGSLSAILRDRLLDHGTATVTLLLISVPEFVVGSLLVLGLAIKWQLFPAVSIFNSDEFVLAQPELLVLPVLTLLAASVAQTIRMVRAALLDVLESDFVQLARLSGVPEPRVILRHALPNAMAPVIQVLIWNFAWLLGGVLIVEVIFAYPGIGVEFVRAITNQDLPVVQAVGMLLCATVIVFNLMADLIIILSNPRLRSG